MMHFRFLLRSSFGTQSYTQTGIQILLFGTMQKHNQYSTNVSLKWFEFYNFGREIGGEMPQKRNRILQKVV